MFDLADDHVEVVLRLGIAAVLEQSRRGENRRERIAKLVREEREEIVLALVGETERGLARADRGFGGALVGHVGRHVDETWFAVDVDARVRHHEPAGAPVSRAEGNLGADAVIALRRGDERGALFRSPNAERHHAVADDLATRIARQLEERVVDADERAVGQTRDASRLRTQVEHRLEAALGRA